MRLTHSAQVGPRWAPCWPHESCYQGRMSTVHHDMPHFLPAHSTCLTDGDPDSKVHGANMGPTWVLPAPDGPHVGPMNFAIMVECLQYIMANFTSFMHSALVLMMRTLIVRFMGPIWDPPGADRTRWAPSWPNAPCYQGRMPSVHHSKPYFLPVLITCLTDGEATRLAAITDQLQM